MLVLWMSIKKHPRLQNQYKNPAYFINLPRHKLVAIEKLYTGISAFA